MENLADQQVLINDGWLLGIAGSISAKLSNSVIAGKQPD